MIVGPILQSGAYPFVRFVRLASKSGIPATANADVPTRAHYSGLAVLPGQDLIGQLASFHSIA
jgi:hypothetical protein